MNVNAFFRLVRFEHAIMLALAVFIGETVVLGKIPDLASPIIILSLLVPIFSEMGSFALNDYLDIETDRLNKRDDRPLANNELSPKFAFYFSWISIFISIGLAYFINLYAFAIAIIFNLLAIAYNYKLKDLPLVGNSYIGLTMAIPFIFGNYVVSDKLAPVAIVLALLGLVSGIAREIIKSVEDMKGDSEARKSKTLPILIGESSARKIASILYLLFIPLTVLPFMYGLNLNPMNVPLIGLADLGILYLAVSVWTTGNAEVMKMARKSSLVCLFIGLIGLLLGIF
ncbi:MAG: UbiA family prenyltransferase [Candidatus Micrarchaeota archaeon]